MSLLADGDGREPCAGILRSFGRRRHLRTTKSYYPSRRDLVEANRPDHCQLLRLAVLVVVGAFVSCIVYLGS